MFHFRHKIFKRKGAVQLKLEKRAERKMSCSGLENLGVFKSGLAMSGFGVSLEDELARLGLELSIDVLNIASLYRPADQVRSGSICRYEVNFLYR